MKPWYYPFLYSWWRVRSFFKKPDCYCELSGKPHWNLHGKYCEICDK